MQLINSFALAAFAVVGVYAQGPMINTPASVVECQPAQITYGGGQAPYFISILPGGMVGAAALEDLGQRSGTSLTWLADIASGTSITFQIRDSTGATGFSAPVTLQSGTDTSCVGKNSQSSSGSSTGAATGSTTQGSSASAPSGASTTSGASAPTTSAASTPGGSSASTPSATSPSSTRTSTSGASSASSGASTGAASQTPNAAITLNSGPAAGIIGLLLAAIIA